MLPIAKSIKAGTEPAIQFLNNYYYYYYLLQLTIYNIFNQGYGASNYNYNTTNLYTIFLSWCVIPGV